MINPRPTRPRRSRPRARTVSPKHLTRAVMAAELVTAEDVAALDQRPRTRADCKDSPRPCPWTSCKQHLYLDINPLTGSIKLNWPDLEPDELTESCALDVADRGGVTLEIVGRLMNLTRERIRMIENLALAKLKSPAARRLGMSSETATAPMEGPRILPPKQQGE